MTTINSYTETGHMKLKLDLENQPHFESENSMQ